MSSTQTTRTTRVSYTEPVRTKYYSNTATGPFDIDITSRMEPSRLLSENEMLRKRNFELELMINRKLNELPDEIAILQSENTHLKSLGHAR